MKGEYDQEAAELTQKLQACEKECKAYSDVFQCKNAWMNAVDQSRDHDKISEELVSLMIRRVMIYEDKRLEIEFRYGEDRDKLERIFRELSERNKLKERMGIQGDRKKDTKTISFTAKEGRKEK